MMPITALLIGLYGFSVGAQVVAAWGAFRVGADCPLRASLDGSMRA